MEFDCAPGHRAAIAIPAWKVALEYDGQEDHGPCRKTADAARQARLEALGWTVIRVTKHDLRRPARLRARLETLPRPASPEVSATEPL